MLSVRRTENTHHGQGLDENPEILEKGKQSKQPQAREPENIIKPPEKKRKDIYDDTEHSVTVPLCGVPPS
jgi:hypothetical protein